MTDLDPAPYPLPESPSEAATLADQALDAEDAPRAAFYLACALSGDPTQPSWREALDGLLQAADDPLTLFSVPDDETPVHPVTAFGHACALHTAGRLLDAWALLLDVAAVAPRLPLLRIATDWALPVDDGRLPVRTLLAPLREWLEQIDAAMPPADVRDMLRADALPLLGRMAEHAPDDMVLLLQRAALHLRAGSPDDAAALAGRAFDLRPQWAAAMILAAAHEEAGRPDQAVDAWQRAVEADPTDHATRLALADCLLALDRLDDAEAAYRHVLDELDAADAHAQASLDWVQYRRTGEERFFLRVLNRAESDDPEPRAAALIDQHVRAKGPWVGYIPEPGDATIDSLRQFTEQILQQRGTDAEAPEGIRLSLTHLEAPSTQLAWEMQMVLLGVDVPLEVQVQQVPLPDPRRPAGDVSFVLWEFDGISPRPGLPPPEQAIAARLAPIAAERFDLDAWAAEAGVLARELGPDHAGDLLSAMLYPPLPPEPVPSWLWVPRVQLAATLTMAQVSPDEPWEESSRRALLATVLAGPADWASSAVVVALRWLAQQGRADAEDVLGMFVAMASRRPDTGYCCWEYALACNALLVPGAPPDVVAKFREWRDRLEQAGR